MLNRNSVPDEIRQAVKRRLKITWKDSDTEKDLLDMITNAGVSLNELIGAEVNYFAPGPERRLFMNYMAYAWNDCENEFEDAYRKDILRLRHKYMVKRAVRNEQEEIREL